MPFDDKINSASNRRNVSPTTSTLNMLVEDFDCSGLASPPEDGQFIVALPGAVSAACTAHAASIDALSETGSALRMVWGSALRSDRSALGDTRVPVVMNGGRFKTKIFLSDEVAPASMGYTAGAALTVAPVGDAADALQGDIARLILCPLQESGSTMGWVVGHVVRVITDSAVSGTAEIEVQIYAQPIHATDNAQA